MQLINSYSLRPCIVKNKHALFHIWEQKSEIIPPSMMVGGHGGGVVSSVFGIIEYEDGTIHKCYPDEIRFIDGLHSDYFWLDESYDPKK